MTQHRDRLPYCFTFPEKVHRMLVRLAKRAYHDNKSRMVEDLITKEYDKQKKAREREREGAA